MWVIFFTLQDFSHKKHTKRMQEDPRKPRDPRFSLQQEAKQ